MKQLIIYGSKYGTSMKYAEWLKSKLGTETEMFAFQNVKGMDFGQYQRIIYIGSLYAGKITGLKKTLKKIPNAKDFVLITVGLSGGKNLDETEKIRKSVKKLFSPDVYQRMSFYHLPGEMHYFNLSLVHKLMIEGMFFILQRQKANSGTEMIKNYRGITGCLDLEAANQIAKILNKDDEK